MFDLVVFTQYPRSHGPKRFYEEVLKMGLSCKIKSYKNVDLDNLPLARFVILREPTSRKNIYNLRDDILKFYLSKGIKVLNSKSYLRWSVLDKLAQHQEFVKAGIPHIPLLKLSKASFPFIAKTRLGSHGDSVYKITNKNDLDNVLKKHGNEELLFQEFLNSGFDLRVIVINSKVVGIMKRTPRQGEFLSNYSQGGKVSMYKGNDIKEIKNIATMTARHFNLDYVGVDLMMGNDSKWKVLEVNRACQFKGFEQVTEVNIAKSLLNSLF